jgi:hypothetical protein
MDGVAVGTEVASEEDIKKEKSCQETEERQQEEKKVFLFCVSLCLEYLFLEDTFLEEAAFEIS